MGARIGEAFFARSTRAVAMDLIGCTLLHRGVGGEIVEVEAYEADDPACHAYVGRTQRNAPLFGPPGRAYVYVCYGIHRMFNVVTETNGTAGAVLVRALRPTHGLGEMRERRAPASGERALCSGPGKICQALAIVEGQTDESLGDGPIAIHGRSEGVRRPEVVTGPRIGITKGAELPWRFCAAGSRFLSKALPGQRSSAGRGASGAGS